MLHRRRPWPAVALAVVSLAAAAAPAVAADAPGAPGAVATWTEGDKDGIGSSTSLESRPLFTLDDGEMTEVYAPDLGTPSIRDLQLVVSDGKTFAEREREDATHRTELADPRSLTYRQVNTARSGRWRITKTYVTDPARDAVLVDVTFESLTGRPLDLYAILDPGLSNSGDDDRARNQGTTLAAYDDRYASALATSPAPSQRSSGYAGASDGWTDLRSDFRMDWAYDAASAAGNVVQTARLPLTGLGHKRRATLSLGFGADPAAAASTATASLAGGFESAADRYAAGWHDYLGGLSRPASVKGRERLYDVSMMVMAALEDKTYRGAGIASPSMAWVWGTIPGYSGPYHLVWSRDLYQVASAQIAAGDRGAGERALDYLWERQMQPDGCFPQNSNLDGTPHWPNLQLDEVADPILLAWQLGSSDARTWSYVRRAAGCILERGPTSQERWENADGYSPATIAAEIAALVVAADIAQRNGAPADAARYRDRADTWQKAVAGWTRTRNGPLSRDPYYLRLTVDGNADAGTTYTIGDGGPTIDQRLVVDTSFLELVRLGVKAANDRDIVSTLPVVDAQLGVRTPNGQFWHRYNFDGYGETPDGGPFPGPGNRGRLWPIFAGERGEYELAAGQTASARGRLADLAATAGEGLMMPEQVWDDQAPPGATPGTGTLSATPLGWTHAQFVRLAWSIDAGRPVERPDVVACRYALRCR
jgi:glucoamylase